MGFKPGDLAIPMVRRPCEHPDCVACRSGRSDFCYTGDYRERGIMKMHGFMTEFVVDEAQLHEPRARRQFAMSPCWSSRSPSPRSLLSR